jgi:hypothetical protein
VAQVKPPYGTPLNLGHPFAQGLIGCWLFNEGYGLSGSLLYDSSGKRNTGILTGGFTAASGWTTGPNGSALLLNGSTSFVDVPKNNFVFNPNTITIYTKVQLITYTSDAYIISNGNSGADGFHLGTYGGSYFIFFFGSIASSFTYSATAPLMNVWYGVTVTFDGLNQRFYINGIFDSVGSPTTHWNPSSVDMNFGRRGQGTNFENCVISEVMMWNRVLSPREILYLQSFPYDMFNPEDSDFTSIILTGRDHLTKGHLFTNS